mgnify:CR=1 FL=1
MKSVKVLGSGCAKCAATTELVKQVAAAKGIAIDLEKIEDLARIVGFGVLSTPAVVVDGKVVHAGGVPERTKVEAWLA